MTPSPGNPWAVREEDFRRLVTVEDQLKFILQYALLAPSSRNMQPWHFRIKGAQVSLHADRSRWQPVSDPFEHEMLISLGCALENLLIALEHFGLGAQVAYQDRKASRGSLVAQVSVGGLPEPAAWRPASLFAAIPKRRTHHGVYTPKPLTPTVLRKLNTCVANDGISVKIMQDPSVMAMVERLTLRADALTLADPEYRDELAECIGAGNFGGPWLLSMAQKFAVMHLGPTRAIVRGDHVALHSSPAFGLISAQTTDQVTLIKAGQLLERLYLSATTQRLFLQPVSQLLEVDEVKLKFSRLFRAAGFPLVPFRLGYAASPAHRTLRRSVDEVLG